MCHTAWSKLHASPKQIELGTLLFGVPSSQLKRKHCAFGEIEELKGQGKDACLSSFSEHKTRFVLVQEEPDYDD